MARLIVLLQMSEEKDLGYLNANPIMLKLLVKRLFQLLTFFDIDIEFQIIQGGDQIIHLFLRGN